MPASSLSTPRLAVTVNSSGKGCLPPAMPACWLRRHVIGTPATTATLPLTACHQHHAASTTTLTPLPPACHRRRRHCRWLTTATNVACLPVSRLLPAAGHASLLEWLTACQGQLNDTCYASTTIVKATAQLAFACLACLPLASLSMPTNWAVAACLPGQPGPLPACLLPLPPSRWPCQLLPSRFLPTLPPSTVNKWARCCHCLSSSLTLSSPPSRMPASVTATATATATTPACLSLSACQLGHTMPASPHARHPSFLQGQPGHTTTSTVTAHCRRLPGPLKSHCLSLSLKSPPLPQ